MRTGWFLVLLWFATSACGRLSGAQEGDTFLPRCLPSDLDVRALPPAFPTEPQVGHRFVLELQNTGARACMLFQPEVELLPPSDPNNNLFLAADRPDKEGDNTEYAPKELEPGGWAHVLFGWVSRSAPEIPCNHYSGLKLHLIDINPNIPVDDRSAIEVRNLWIRSCPSVFVSGYRKGKYSPQSKLTTNWFNSWAPAVVPESSYPEQPTSSQISSNSPLLNLHVPVTRSMVGDHLQLRLRFPRGADEGCAYRVLRKRESTGATVIAIQQCTAGKSGPEKPVPPYFEAGTARLEIEALDLLALKAGPVSYEVIGAVDGVSSHFAAVHVDLVARDPTLPEQVAILNPLPTCTGSQLRVDSLDPVVSARLQTLRAYQIRNISNETCSIAGVPALRFLDDKGNNEPFVPKACPNCDNDLFKTRPNGRIDLKPGDSAHFLVGATAIDTEEDPWMHCQRASQLELTVSEGDKAVVLPLDAGVCAAIDISAWRAGTFDHDPRNLEWGRAHAAVLREPDGPVPRDCAKPELLALGRPSMMPSRGSVAWGLSVASHRFVKGEPAPLHLWIDNAGDEPIGVWTCMELDYFKDRGFDLFDAYGHRVLRKREINLSEECRKDPKVAQLERAWSCTRNFEIPIPAHTCVNGDNYDFTSQLAQEYDLPPGEYTVHLRDGNAESTDNICAEHQDAPLAITPAKDLTFEVVQP